MSSSTFHFNDSLTGQPRRPSRLYGNQASMAVSSAALAHPNHGQISRSASASNHNNNNVNRIVADLLDVQRANRRSAAASMVTASTPLGSRPQSRSQCVPRLSPCQPSGGGGGGGCRPAPYLSHVEQAILRSSAPVQLNETEEITVNGERGLWANRDEVVNWRGPIPISQYKINADCNPEIVTKRANQTLEYIQEIAIRYLRPPTPPPPGEILITQECNTLTPPAPPLIIRQQPARPATPEPLIVREAPPQAPPQIGRKVITISGKRLPPPPRKVIIERLAPIPCKPQSVIIERWLPYAEVKRRVIFNHPCCPDPEVCKPRNVIVQWEAPHVQIKKEFKYLGVIKANPAEYVRRYGASLTLSRNLPDFVLDIKTPSGLVLAADHKRSELHELEGDVEALRLVDLDKEGLGEYREYLANLGLLKSGSLASIKSAIASLRASSNHFGSGSLTAASASAVIDPAEAAAASASYTASAADLAAASASVALASLSAAGSSAAYGFGSNAAAHHHGSTSAGSTLAASAPTPRSVTNRSHSQTPMSISAAVSAAVASAANLSRAAASAAASAANLSRAAAAAAASSNSRACSRTASVAPPTQSFASTPAGSSSARIGFRVSRAQSAAPPSRSSPVKQQQPASSSLVANSSATTATSATSTSTASEATLPDGGPLDSSSVVEVIFKSIDTQNHGRISVEDAEKILLRLNSRLDRRYGEDDVNEFFAALDVNQDRTIDLDEFRNAFKNLDLEQRRA